MEIRSLLSLVDGQICDVVTGYYWQETARSIEDQCVHQTDKEIKQYATNPANNESSPCQLLVYPVFRDLLELKTEPWKLERMGGPNNADGCEVANPGPGLRSLPKAKPRLFSTS
jgi:hypothetical protein